MTNAIITALHLACLSMVESGDVDTAIGKDGEVSRWQALGSVLPDLGGQDVSAQEKRVLGEWVARANGFKKRYRRNPTTIEIYLLWHRPARVMNPLTHELERAIRFQNLFDAGLKRVQGNGS